MSVNIAKSSNFFRELDIVKVARELGIDQERLLAYIYARPETIKPSDGMETVSPTDHT